MARLATDCVLFVTLATASWLALDALAAPVPRPKAVVRPEINGGYDMYWGGTLYPALLLPGGIYGCQNTASPPTRWEGKWELAGDKLTITERMIYAGGERGDWFTYNFTLERGKLRDGDRFRLVPVGR